LLGCRVDGFGRVCRGSRFVEVVGFVGLYVGVVPTKPTFFFCVRISADGFTRNIDTYIYMYIYIHVYMCACDSYASSARTHTHTHTHSLSRSLSLSV